MELKAQQELIENFVSSIEKKYPEIKVEYTYDKDLELHEVLHDSSELQFEDKSFLEFVGTQILEKIYNMNIYNISFGYDHDKYSYSKDEVKNKLPADSYQIQKDTITSYNNQNIIESIGRKVIIDDYSISDLERSKKSVASFTDFLKFENREANEKKLLYKGNQSIELANIFEQSSNINILEHQEGMVA